jgi:multiphosphoryl transfer protein
LGIIKVIIIMVNLLLVSHSKKLVEGVAEMAGQMVNSDQVKIATAAGVGEDNQELGTNAMEIVEAIEEIYTEDGILVLMDLGSAILSTEMALDIIPEEMKAKIKICPAPFVEGAISAGVQAGLGSDLETVYREAMNALRAKVAQLSEGDEGLLGEEASPDITPKMEGETSEVTLSVPNEQGLHARPAALFVRTIKSFDAQVMVKNLTEDKGPFAVNSLISLMLVAGRQGHSVQITAEGPQKEAVIAALVDLFERNFDE